MKEGEIAPDFELPDHDGKTVSLASFRGIKAVVLCFYPKNRIFGCPSKKIFKMAENVVSMYPDILAADAVLFAVSVDTVEDQKKFVDKYRIPYPHLSDPGKETCRQYAGLNVAGLAKRTTFVIDKEGKIARILRKMSADSHGQEIVSVLKQV